MSLKKIIILIITILIVTGAKVAPVFGYVMESSHFRIQRDSINIGGSEGNSADFSLQDTLGEAGTGLATSTSFNLYGGYQQMDVARYISLTIPVTTTLGPAITGLTGGMATGTSDLVVRTNNSAGYTLSIVASTTPAMQRVGGGDSFADYAPATSTAPDFHWAIVSTSSAFGFSPEGSDVATRYLDNGAMCNYIAGANTADACWDGFSTSTKIISQSFVGNDPDSSTTTLKLQAQSGSQHVQASGAYRAALVVTAYMN